MSIDPATARQMEGLGLEWDYELTPETGLEQANVSGDKDEIGWGTAGRMEVPGLTRCLGIVVLDHSNDTGYAMHFTTEGRSVDFSEASEFHETVGYPLEQFNSALMAHDVDFENAEIAAAGANYGIQLSDKSMGDTGEMQELAKEGAIKRNVETYMEQQFGESHAYWEMEDGHMGELAVDMDEGEITYDPASEPIYETVEETV
jgi:hypothetical protein